MSTLITDTLKVKGDKDIPVALAKDVHVNYDDTDLETALEPATDVKLGTVKVGANMNIDTDGTLSITNRVSIDNNQPNDNTTVWVDDTIEPKTTNSSGVSQIIEVSKEEYNNVSMQDDGLFASTGHTLRPSPIWTYASPGILYYKGWGSMLSVSGQHYYISATGDDTYGDGTAANPRKTIGFIPRNLNGYGINIHISGDYKSLKQDFIIAGFFGGYINIYMEGNPSFWRLSIYNNQARIYIRESFSAYVDSTIAANLKTGWIQAVYMGGNSCVYFSSDTATTEGHTVTITSGGTGTFTSTAGLTTCRWRGMYLEGGKYCADSRVKIIVQNAYQGLISHSGSRVNINRLQTKNCTYGLTVGQSHMACETYTSTSNSNAYSIYNGGRYYTSSQSSIGRY